MTDREGLLMFYFENFKPGQKGAAGKLAQDCRSVKQKCQRKPLESTGPALWESINAVVKDFCDKAIKQSLTK